MDIGRLQFKLADRCYFDLLRKCLLYITTEAMKSRNFSFLFPWNATEAFHSSRNIPATILLTFCYLLYQAFSSDNFLLNQTSSFINILQIIDRKVIFDTVFAPTTYTKELSAHLANTVEPFQSSWTNGKQFAYVSTVQMKFRHTRQLSLCQRNQYFSRLTVTEEVFGEIFALKNKVLHFKLA